MKYSLYTLIILAMALANVGQSEESTSYSYSKVVDLSYDDALTKVTAELKKQDFGIITEIDVQATMKKKLDAEIKPYKILGACNAKFASEALQQKREIGLFLPCNVIVYVDENGKTVVSAVDPVAMMMAVDNPSLGDTAKVRERLKLVIDSL